MIFLLFETHLETLHDKPSQQNGQGLTATNASKNQKKLRFSVQTLGGHICDGEDEDSETDDGEFETDEEQVSKRSDRFMSNEQQRGGPGGNLGARDETKKNYRRLDGAGVGLTRDDKDIGKVSYRRMEELGSVLRRLRGAVRRMDGILTESEVPHFLEKGFECINAYQRAICVISLSVFVRISGFVVSSAY